MPTPIKQRAGGNPTASAGDVLGRIVKVGAMRPAPLKVSLYGRAKTGKTRLLSTFPKPVLIIGPEDGTQSIKGVDGVDFYPLEDSSDVLVLVENIQRLGYLSVGVDTATALYDLILSEIIGKPIPEQKSWGMATRDQYGQAGLKLKTLLRKIIELPLHVVVTAHERNFKEDGDSDLIAPTIGSALSPSAAGWLNGAVDYICQTYIREGTTVKIQTIGSGATAKQIPMTQKTGGAEYCLRVGPHPVYQTGFRLPPGYVLPDSIVDPDFDKIMAVVEGKYGHPEVNGAPQAQAAPAAKAAVALGRPAPKAVPRAAPKPGGK